MDLEQDHKQCLEKLIWATDQLQVEVAEAELGKIADIIVQTMTGPWRCFHTPGHIFAVGGSENAIEVLAALFHDVVYVQVDRSINFNLTYYIAPFIRQVGEQLVILESTELPRDLMFEMVMSVFGLAPGQVLSPMAGQNEFLSALVAAKVLEGFVKPEILVQIVTCIEAFLGRSPEGLTPSEGLYGRLQSTNSKFDLKLTDTQMRSAVRQAVRLSNRDVGGFGHPSAVHFMDNTWSLLLETNHNLKNSTTYTVHEYRMALQKMEGFMHFMKPELVFNQFDGEPNDRDYRSLLANSKQNIEIGRIYLGSKLASIAILEALSLRFGHDILLLTMVAGGLPEEGSGDPLSDMLPIIEKHYEPKTEIECEVLKLLEVGRTKSSTYDIKNSPLTTFMVKYQGFDEILYQLKWAKDFFKGNISAEDFISGCDPHVLQVVINGVVKVFDSRKAALCRS
ncbi:MAG: hypothetical protein GDA38_15735 [Hormoscilla sp. SP12CHS1]|nr:hypothetical protein [Hormoscilla sp. SP12CHS1]